MTLSDLSRELLKEILSYDENTGKFTRLLSKSTYDRGTVGALNSFGHRQIRVGGKLYQAHRLAWLYHCGDWPSTNIDHINGLPDDNRIVNLRLATPKQNQENVKLNAKNTSEYRGVTWSKSEKKWVVRVSHFSERILIGKFDSLRIAATRAKNARDMLFTHNNTEYSS